MFSLTCACLHSSLLAGPGFLNYPCDWNLKSRYTDWLPVNRWCVTVNCEEAPEGGLSNLCSVKSLNAVPVLGIGIALVHLCVFLCSTSGSWKILNCCAPTPTSRISHISSSNSFDKALEQIHSGATLSGYLSCFLHFRKHLAGRILGMWVSWTWVQNNIFQESPWMSL